MEEIKYISLQPHAAIDITKLIMAFLVIAIHTEPFGFSFWLDKGFGIITRLCVPFFFVASSYFFFLKNGSALRYVKRLLLLYVVWSVIYLPFDIVELKTMSIPEIALRYFWAGNGHALWYLCGSIVAFFIVFGLSKIMVPEKIFYIAVAFLIVGTFKSTYAPLLEKIFDITVKDFMGSRNGLFYGFVYYALGLCIAKTDTVYGKPHVKNIVGMMISLVLLMVESFVFVYMFKTRNTILWLSVLPLTYNFFMVVKSIQIPIAKTTSIFIRKCSTTIYVSHCFVMGLFAELKYFSLFLVVTVLSVIISVFIVCMSQKQGFKWLKILY